MNRYFYRLFFLLFFGTALSPFAQTAQFSGRVSDPHQARVQHAQVRVVSQTTGVERKAATDAEGFYLVPFVPPGTYQIFVQASGFSPDLARISHQS